MLGIDSYIVLITSQKSPFGLIHYADIKSSFPLYSSGWSVRIKRLISELGFRHKSLKKFFLKYSRTDASETLCSDDVLRYRCLRTVLAIEGVRAIICTRPIAMQEQRINRSVASTVFKIRERLSSSTTPGNSDASVFFLFLFSLGIAFVQK